MASPMGDVPPDAHVDDGAAPLGPLPTIAWRAILPNNECQGERPINHAAQLGRARNVAKPRCPGPANIGGLQVGCAHQGFELKRGKQLMPLLLESPLGANWASKRQPGSRRALQPRRVYTSERVRHADLGTRRFKMSSPHSSARRTSEAYLVIACCTTQLGWAKHTATSNWRRVCGKETAHCAKSSPTRSPS